jgi:hypothetical protein
MARIRTVKPELFRHEGLFDLEKETGLPIRLSWIGLFTCCDREGRFKWRPRQLKSEILPFDDEIDFSRVLDALFTRGFVVKYRVDNEDYGHIPTWNEHQVINNRESESALPEPVETFCLEQPDACLTRDERVPHATQGERKGKERNKEGDMFALPDWIPQGLWDEWYAWRAKRKLPISVRLKNQHVEKLQELKSRGHPPEKVLEMALERGWQGLFEPREAFNGKQARTDTAFEIIRNA